MASEIYARKKEIFNDLIDAQKVPLRPGVNYIVDEAISAGIKLAVCSSSDDSAVQRVVGLMGKERASHFRIFAAGSISRLKPDPEVYTLALRSLGVPAEDAVAIEDSRDGLLAAKAAGIACIVVTTGYTAVDIPSLSPATYQFRVFATVGKVPGDPCQPVGLTLH